MKKKTRKISSLLLILLVILVVVPVVGPTIASEAPYVVSGRVLTASRAGDSSDWIEIARSGDYSLIVRKDTVVNTGFGSNAQYSTSTARTRVNSWFSSSLSSGARLRDFTVRHDALSQIGSWTSANSGLSRPNGTAARTGDDVAFLLSFGEAAQFCSTQFANTSASYQRSVWQALGNFNQLNQLTGQQPTGHWWLRTNGNLGDRACTVGMGGSNEWGTDLMRGAVNQYQVSSNIIGIRPALWVGSGIFLDNVTITYHANGGIGAPSPQTVSPGNVTLSNTRPTYGSIQFLGWSTNQFATTAQYNAGQTINVTGNMDLYAVWNKAEIIVIHMDRDNNRSMLEENHVIPAGAYGPYAPRTFPGYGPGRLAAGSAPVSGTINAFTTRTIIFDYNLATVTITYHANGGTGAPPPLTAPQGNVTLSTTTPTYGPILFMGWATSASATIPQYFAGQTINVSSDMDLYAVWYKAEIIVIHRNSENNQPIREDNHVIPAGTYGPYTPDTFPGYGPGRHVPSSAPVSGTITAFTTRTIIFEYDMLRVTITYHANGGIGAPPPQTVTPGNVTLSTTTPTYGPILFMGWATNELATIPQYLPGQTINVSSDMDLYAVWYKAEIVVIHMDKEEDQAMREDRYVIPAGTYGPYAPDTFPGYAPGRHVPSSAPPSGTITAFTTRTIIYEYDRLRTVTGLVWPMVVDDLGIGPDFLRLHDIVVELRPSFNRPAAPGLSTAAIVLPNSAVDGIGRFTINNVPYGDYLLTIKRPGYLVRCMEVRITATSPLVVNLAPPPTDPNDAGVFRLWWGDCNNDFRIDGLDVSMMAALINLNALHPSYTPHCDLNADGQINGLDITMISGNWNKNARQYAGAELVNFDD